MQWKSTYYHLSHSNIFREINSFVKMFTSRKNVALFVKIVIMFFYYFTTLWDTKLANFDFTWSDIKIRITLIVWKTIENYYHQKIFRQISYIFSDFFSNFVAFTKFLPKKCESKFPFLPHCDKVFANSYMKSQKRNICHFKKSFTNSHREKSSFLCLSNLEWNKFWGI